MWLQIIINDVSQLLPVTDVEWGKNGRGATGDIKSKMSEIKRKKKVEKEKSG